MSAIKVFLNPFQKYLMIFIEVINRPGVAGAVLQTPLLLIDLLINSLILCGNIFKTLSFPNGKSKGADILRKMLTPHLVSHVTCHISRVTCDLSSTMFYFFQGKQSVRRSVINGTYPIQFSSPMMTNYVFQTLGLKLKLEHLWCSGSCCKVHPSMNI